MTYQHFCFTTEEHRKIPYLHLSSNDEQSKKDKVRVWLQGAAHGDEPGGDQAVMAFLGALDHNETLALSLLDRLEIIAVPRYNPDGVFYLQDTFATNFDPNRDHMKLFRQQTRDIKRELNKFSPHLALDIHEYTATRSYGRWHMGADSLFAPGRNHNIHPAIRNMSELLFSPRLRSDLAKYNITTGSYVTSTGNSSLDYEPTFTEAGSDAKIGRNNVGLTQAISFLSETRGIQLTDQHFQRRVSTGMLTIFSLLNTAWEHAEDVLTIVEEGIQETISGNRDIVVTDSPQELPGNVTLIDLTDNSIGDRAVKYRSASPTKIELTRSRPEAYIIPAAWADVAARLTWLGLEIEKLDTPFKGDCEVLTVETAELATEYYEGAIRNAVTTNTTVKSVELPSQSFRVSTRQKNAALLFTALEPEGIDSFVTFNIIPVSEGDEYPVFRVV